MERIRNKALGRDNVTRTALTNASIRRYDAGTVLTFGVGGNVEPYLGAGWSKAEPEFRWTEGESVELIFDFEKAPGELILSFVAHPQVGDGVDAQNVIASWNGVPVGEWEIREGGSYHTVIWSPLGIGAASAHCMLQFIMPDAFSPLSRNLSNDSRQLGLAFHELVLRPASELSSH